MNVQKGQPLAGGRGDRLVPLGQFGEEVDEHVGRRDAGKGGQTLRGSP